MNNPVKNETTVKTKLLNVYRRIDGLYDAIVEVSYVGGKARVGFARLVREPRDVKAREKQGKIMIELLDFMGTGFASCILTKEELSKGRVDLSCSSTTPWVMPVHG